MIRSRGVSFFFYLSLALLIVALLGFGPSFYLAPVLGAPEKFGTGFPSYILVHGVVFSAWFVLLPLQAFLVARGKFDVHRILGMVGTIVALAVVVTGAVTTVQVIPRFEAAGIPIDEAQGVFVGNSVVLAAFAGLFVAAIWRRSSPAVHKRLMVLASCAAIAPALTTNRMLGSALQSILPEQLSPLVFFWLLVIGSMIARDLVRERAIASTTRLGIALLALGVLINLMLLHTGFGADYTHWLAAPFIR
jgi:hypothetical protein